nr:hypothetical protein [Tanacetum cinerariifolium]
MENEIDFEKKIKELANFIFKVGHSAHIVHMLTKPQAFYDNIHKQALGYQNPFYLKKAQQIKPTLYDGIVISSEHVAMPVIDDEETLILEEDFGKHFVPQQEFLADEAVWYHMLNPSTKSSVALHVQIETPKELPKGMFKLDLVPLAPKLLQNREAHIDYLKYTQEQADILQGMVKQAKAKQPLDNALDFACKHAQRIQELLVYVRDTCPNAIKPSAKKVAVTPKKNVKKVRFAEPLTSSSNIKQVESTKTSDSNTPVLSHTGLKCSTSNYGSKPSGNKKNDMISQIRSRNMKNKVNVQPRNVNKKNRVVQPIHNVDVKQSQLNANSKLICSTCKKSMFNDVHDMCLLDFVKNVNSRAKSAKKHKSKIFGNLRVMNTSANVVPPKKTTSYSVETQKPKLKVYRRKPENVKNVGSSKKAKIVESKNANHSEPNHTWGSNATDIQSSSSFVMTGIVRFKNDHVARIMGYGDYQLGNVTILRVYYVEGLGSVGQFCDADLEVAFWKNTCFIRNLEGVDLISGSRDKNLYTISLDDMLKTSPICLLLKASKTKSWLWNRRLSHLNFDTLNKLAKDGLARGIPRLKFQK